MTKTLARWLPGQPPRSFSTTTAAGADGLYTFTSTIDNNVQDYRPQAQPCGPAAGRSELAAAEDALNVADQRMLNPLTEALIEAGVELGLSRREDLNGPDFHGPEPDGIGPVQVTLRRGRRCSAADAYLRPARRRGNLTVRTGAHVTAARPCR